MRNFFKSIRYFFSNGWSNYRRMITVKQCGFDPWEYQKRMEYLHQRISTLEDDNRKLKEQVNKNISDMEDNGYVHIHVDDLEHYKKVHDRVILLHKQFPVYIRKMWSGGEIVTWLRDQQKEILRKR